LCNARFRAPAARHQRQEPQVLEIKLTKVAEEVQQEKKVVVERPKVSGHVFKQVFQKVF
jgi:hypothetical protein